MKITSIIHKFVKMNVYINYKWYKIAIIMIELMLLKELMLIKQVHQKSVTFCHYWYFLNFSFKFQPNVCNRCHDLFMMYKNFSNIAILNIKGSDYRCIVSLIRKDESINLMQKYWFDWENRNIIKYKNLLSHIRMGKKILAFGNIKVEKNKFYSHKTLFFQKIQILRKYFSLRLLMIVLLIKKACISCM